MAYDHIFDWLDDEKTLDIWRDDGARDRLDLGPPSPGVIERLAARTHQHRRERRLDHIATLLFAIGVPALVILFALWGRP